MLRTLICFLFLTASAYGAELTLKDKLGSAEPGSYVVTEQNKNYTFLHVHQKLRDAIVLEEVSISAARFNQCGLCWRDWFENGAPGHTSWTLSQINLQTGKFEESFSFTQNGWIDMSQSNNFLTTLLNLPFQEVPDCYRRRTGSNCQYIWNPRLIVDGTPVYNIPFTAWKARWPNDGSELARKVIEIYIPIDPWDASIPKYPTYFPYWVEVEGKLGSARVRVVDSGMGATSPRSHLPRRSPEFIGNGILNQEGLLLKLKCPAYFKDFILLAEEVDSFRGSTFPLPHTFEAHGETLVLKVSSEILGDLLTQGERYRFLLSPKDEPFFCIETKDPIPFINKSTANSRQS